MSYNVARFAFDFIDVFFHVPQNAKRFKDITCEKDIVYDENYKEARKLDIYYKKDHDFNKLAPVLLNIHGGGFVAGGKEHRVSIAKFYADLGFVVFNISYCLAPKYTYPEIAQSYIKAVNFIASNKEKYNIDIGNLVITGDSSGGHATTLLCALYNHKDLREKLGTDEFNSGIKIGYALPFCGCYDGYELLAVKLPFKGGLKLADDISRMGTIKKEGIEKLREWEYFKEFSPINYVDSNFPKCFVSHCKDDMFCNHQGEFLIEKLKENNVEFEEYFATRALDLHCFHLIWSSKSSKECMAQIKDYLNKEVISKY